MDPLEPKVKLKAVPFPVNGQGTFIYNTKSDWKFSIIVTPQCGKDGTPRDYIALRIAERRAYFVERFEAEGIDRILKEKQDDSDAGVESGTMVSYWFSYDRDGFTLKYGKGYRMEETTVMSYTFSPEERKESKVLPIFFNPDQKKYVWLFVQPSISFRPMIDVEPTCQFFPNPFVCDESPFVLDSSKVTLFDLDRNQYIFSSSLPQACQELYSNIKALTLDWPEDPILKLSDALRYSIVTPGCTLYNKLEEKRHEFGPHAPTTMTYLRVTLGPNQRTGPGIPYVLEIWPSGHMSPVHNHGGSCAIIKVLFGRITVNVYNKLTDPPPNELKVIKKFDAKEGDITWISPNWFQTHKLHNNTDDFCATIQCYRYQSEDMIHWPGFDFVGQGTEHGTDLDIFYPNSDFTFMEIRGKVLKEYRKYLERRQPQK